MLPFYMKPIEGQKKTIRLIIQENKATRMTFKIDRKNMPHK
jgi:hypothetical protein